MKYKALILKYVPCIFYNMPCFFFESDEVGEKMRGICSGKKDVKVFLCGCVMWKLWYVAEGRGCSLRQKESRTEEIVCGLRRNGNGIKESECALG